MVFERERQCFQGITVDNLGYSDAVRQIKTLTERGEHSWFEQMITLTPKMFIAARKDNNFAAVLERAALVIPESKGLQVYSWLNPPHLVRTNGTYLAELAIAMCAENDKSIVLLGASPDVRVEARAKLLKKHHNANIQIVEGEYRFTCVTDSNIVAQQLEHLHPDLVIMAGTQIDAERWIDLWIRDQVPGGVIGNFGQTLELWAGVRHNPTLLRKIGLEWLYRLTIDPQGKRTDRMQTYLLLGKLALLDRVMQRSKFR